MDVSIFVLVISWALFFFYIQTICERALRQEFSRPHAEHILNVLQLEYPLVRKALESNSPVDFQHALRALKCDFVTLEYLIKNGDGSRRRVSRETKMLFSYFRFLLFCLSVPNAQKFRGKEAVLKLATMCPRRNKRAAIVPV